MDRWTEDDSATYRDIADVAVPRREEMVRALVDAVPFDRDRPFRSIELGAGDGWLAERLLDGFPRATLVALDGSASMRERAAARTARFGARIEIRAVELMSLDWWDVMRGADLVVSSLCLHHLNDAKKQYLYKAAAERLSDAGALLIADVIEPMHPAARRIAADRWDEAARAQADAAGRTEAFARFVESRWNHFRFPDTADHPSPLFHQLVWLKHAGFAAVECHWLYAGHAVFGGYKSHDSSRH